MKLIEESKIQEYYDLILKSDLAQMNSTKATLFFPLFQEEAVDQTEEGLILLEAKKTGSIKFIRPGFILATYEDDDKNEVKRLDLAYVTTEYATLFNIKDHYRYLKAPVLKKKDILKLSELECYLVRNETILGTFKY
jgi:hypothetical protein